MPDSDIPSRDSSSASPPPRNGPSWLLPSHEDHPIYPSVLESDDSERVLGRILTSLEADEISVGLPSRSSADPLPTQARTLNVRFRHSGWKERRDRVLRALQAREVAPATIERFQECGARAWVLRDRDNPGRVRLATNRCRCRWCTPCSVEQQRMLCANIRTACTGRELRFLTLTLKASARSLGESLARLRSGFRKLRQRVAFRGKIKGGVYFVEIKLGRNSGQWHPHLHVLFEGDYLPQQQLRDEWLSITGDSYIVHVCRIHDSGKAAGYVAKYASKAVPAEVVRDHGRLCEAMDALDGTRTFHAFGTWTGLKLSKPSVDGTVWVPLMPLAACIMRANAGDPQCRETLSRLRRSGTDDPLDALFDP